LRGNFGIGEGKPNGDGHGCKKEVGNPLEDQRVSGNSPLWLLEDPLGSEGFVKWWFAFAMAGKAMEVWRPCYDRSSMRPGSVPYGRRKRD